MQSKVYLNACAHISIYIDVWKEVLTKKVNSGGWLPRGEQMKVTYFCCL